MITAKDVPASKLIPKIAEELKKHEQIKQPQSLTHVKSGLCAERPPEQADFWYVRSAAMLRRIYLTGPVGVQRLRTVFGSRRRRGHKPPHHYMAGGKMIRTMLQQMEKSGLIEKADKPRRGRVVSPKGRKLMDSLTKGMR